MARFEKAVDAYIQPRWAKWLCEQRVTSGLAKETFADILGTSPDGTVTAKRERIWEWMNIPKEDETVRKPRTVSAEIAFSVGSRMRASTMLRQFGDGCCALYAAGYLGLLAAYLESLLDAALAAYPHRRAIERYQTLGDFGSPAVRQLRYILMCAVALPISMAHIDGVPDAVIPSETRRHRLDEVLQLSDAEFDKDGWGLKRTVKERGPLRSRGASLTLSEQETLEWVAFQNRISVRARRDIVLQLHFSVMRESVDLYQASVFAVSHHSLRTDKR